MSSEVNSTKKVGSRADTTKSKVKYQFPSSNHNEDSKKKTKLTTNAKKENPRVPVKEVNQYYSMIRIIRFIPVLS